MVKVAILGYGTVGGGVAEILHKNGAHISQRVDNPVEVKYILTRRDYPGDPFEDKIVQDFSIIEHDPEVRVVAECIGGTTVALDYARRALNAGKHVVTSNKELVAAYGYELLQIAKEKGCSFLFEASVGGGIPILRPMSSCLAANELSEIVGILNGTTNYILTRMIRGGLSFDAALKEAQEKGYAEADPTADIEGHDACRKICILSSLGFGRHIYPEQVPTEGITHITLSDVAFARSGDMKIKLLGRAIRREDDKVCAYVAPHLVSDESPLANVEDVFNAISVKGDAIGDVMFYGRGAGKLPTASAVVADVMDAAKHLKTRKYISWAEGGPDTVYSIDEVRNRWYVRVKAGTALPEGCTVLSNPDDAACAAFITSAELNEKEVRALCPADALLACYRVLE